MFAILLAAQQWLSIHFEHQVLGVTKEKVTAVTDGAINGLNMLTVTKSGAIDVINDTVIRALFIQKMGGSEKMALWSRTYFVSTFGAAPLAIIKQDIEDRSD